MMVTQAGLLITLKHITISKLKSWGLKENLIFASSGDELLYDYGDRRKEVLEANEWYMPMSTLQRKQAPQ